MRFELATVEKRLQLKSVTFTGNSDLTSKIYTGVSNDHSAETWSKFLSTFSSEMKMKRIITTEEKTRTVFVGNAPLSSNKKELENYFRSSMPLRVYDYIILLLPSLVINSYFTRNGEKFGRNLLRLNGCCGKRKCSCKTAVFIYLMMCPKTSLLHILKQFCFYNTYKFFKKDSLTLEGLVMVKVFAFVVFKENEAVSFAYGLMDPSSKSVLKGCRRKTRLVTRKRRLAIL
ncbi:unnamed protein product [Cercopithifilaria johnstoni]|uniref:Uncharacterized protein n=1 Tax=Cercopithifilaria johnstoni TaxID=2874296 RepID=A0A8J2LZ18_9BILA|nr:unnamed protein product [Cercopithifilaria johnstoni]